MISVFYEYQSMTQALCDIGDQGGVSLEMASYSKELTSYLKELASYSKKFSWGGKLNDIVLMITNLQSDYFFSLEMSWWPCITDAEQSSDV